MAFLPPLFLLSSSSSYCMGHRLTISPPPPLDSDWLSLPSSTLFFHLLFAGLYVGGYKKTIWAFIGKLHSNAGASGDPQGEF